MVDHSLDDILEGFLLCFLIGFFVLIGGDIRQAFAWGNDKSLWSPIGSILFENCSYLLCIGCFALRRGVRLQSLYSEIIVS